MLKKIFIWVASLVTKLYALDKKCCDRGQRIGVRKKKRHGISGASLTGKVPCSENLKMQTASEGKKKKAFSLNRKYAIWDIPITWETNKGKK